MHIESCPLTGGQAEDIVQACYKAVLSWEIALNVLRWLGLSCRFGEIRKIQKSPKNVFVG